MELGNLLMGHSRDAVPVSDCHTYREVMQKTWAKIRANGTYQPTVSAHVMFFDPLIPTQIQALADVHLRQQLASLQRSTDVAATLLLEYKPILSNEDSK